jgi:hypothetical protein
MYLNNNGLGAAKQRNDQKKKDFNVLHYYRAAI